MPPRFRARRQARCYSAALAVRFFSAPVILPMLGWSAALFIATRKIWQSLGEITLFQAWKNWFFGAVLWTTWLAPAALAVMAAMG